MIGLTILLALFLVSLCECRICSDTSNLTVMDGETVVFSVDKSTQKTTAVELSTIELNADKCNCKSVQSTEIAELQAMVAKLNTTLTALSSATPTTAKTTTTKTTTTATTPKPGSTSGDLTTALSRIATLETTVATLQSKITALESNSTANASVVFVSNTARGLAVTVTCPTGIVVNCINRGAQVRRVSSFEWEDVEVFVVLLRFCSNPMRRRRKQAVKAVNVSVPQPQARPQ
jgi:hypothetical protein